MEIRNPLPSQVSMLRELWKEAFSDTDEFLDMFFTNAFHPCRSMCITIESKVVSVLYWFDCTCRGNKTAYIYAVATANSHRSQGLCRKLMEHTHEHLKNLGYSGAILVPGSKELFSFYERTGYRTSCYNNESRLLANTQTVSIKKLSKEDFARYRKTYLPHNSVIQENENLDFLSSFAEFYMGEDFVFAAYKDSDTLVITEFLGNTSEAAAVINTMGCSKGFLRTEGNSKPFAMYHPFDHNASPAYFGLAFD